MRARTSFAATLAVLFAFFVGAPAGATTVMECKDAIDVVSPTGVRDFDTATIAGLNSKLQGASLVLIQGKFKKALGKLEDFKSTVEELRGASKPGISKKNAAILLEDVDRAIECVESLIKG